MKTLRGNDINIQWTVNEKVGVITVPVSFVGCDVKVYYQDSYGSRLAEHTINGNVISVHLSGTAQRLGKVSLDVYWQNVTTKQCYRSKVNNVVEFVDNIEFIDPVNNNDCLDISTLFYESELNYGGQYIANFDNYYTKTQIDNIINSITPSVDYNGIVDKPFNVIKDANSGNNIRADANQLVTLLYGAIYGDYVADVSGAYIDDQGNAEFKTIKIREGGEIIGGNIDEKINEALAKWFYTDSNGYLHTKLVFIGDKDIATLGSTPVEGSGGSSTIVVDNLNSSSATAALSANQGRILKALIDAKVSIVTWSDIQNKPTTIAGYGITDAASKSLFDAHATNNTIHITDAERSNWNTAYNSKHNHSNMTALNNLSSSDMTAWSKVVTDWNSMFEITPEGYLKVKVVLVGSKDIVTIGSTPVEGGGGSSVIVVDNLLSTSSTAALSANQGRILKEEINTKLSTISWGDIQNKPTDLANIGYVDWKVASIVDNAPEALDTLIELANALGNDPNFAATVANQIGTKLDKDDVRIAGWEIASTNQHTHLNKAILDGIIQIDIDNWDSKAEGDHKHNSLFGYQWSTVVPVMDAGEMYYNYNINQGLTGLFNSIDNANGILTINRHNGNYNSQLGFSGDGNFYYRNFNSVPINNTKGWDKVYTSGNVNMNTVDWLCKKLTSNSIESVSGLIKSSSFGALTIERTNSSAGAAGICFQGVTGKFGYIGMNNSMPHLMRFNKEVTVGYVVYDAENANNERVDWACKDLIAYSSILSGGDVTATSDRRVKSNIKTLKNRGYIIPKTYIKDGKSSIGFIAQEANKKYPELVHGDEAKELLSFNYQCYTAVLQAQIIELADKLNKATKEINKLKKNKNGTAKCNNKQSKCCT